MGKMHTDEVDIDIFLVRRLVARQFPQWADLPLKAVGSAGTVNAVYRLGSDMVVRIPRVEGGANDVYREQQKAATVGSTAPHHHSRSSGPRRTS